jgi:hypothetical protein
MDGCDRPDSRRTRHPCLRRNRQRQHRQVAPVSEGNLIKLRVPVLCAVEGSLAFGDRGSDATGREIAENSAYNPTFQAFNSLLRSSIPLFPHSLFCRLFP